MKSKTNANAITVKKGHKIFIMAILVVAQLVISMVLSNMLFKTSASAAELPFENVVNTAISNGETYVDVYAYGIPYEDAIVYAQNIINANVSVKDIHVDYALTSNWIPTEYGSSLVVTQVAATYRIEYYAQYQQYLMCLIDNGERYIDLKNFNVSYDDVNGFITSYAATKGLNVRIVSLPSIIGYSYDGTLKVVNKVYSVFIEG